MKHSKRRKRRSQPSKQQNCSSIKINGGTEEEKIISSLVEAFSLASIEEAKAAYKEANSDPNKAAEILSGLLDNSENFHASSSSSTQSFGFDSNSNSSENSSESNRLPERFNSKSSRGSRGKRVVAAAGTVSTVIGKDYVSSTPRKGIVKEKEFVGGKVNVEETEQFLISMLGDNCELGMDVVKDVLCTCGFDVVKALEVLFDLSTPHCVIYGSDKYSSSSSSSAEYTGNIDSSDNFWQLSDWGSDSYSHSSESDVPDNLRLLDFNSRNYAEVVSSDPKPAAGLRTDGSQLPHQVLESLFHVPKSSEHDPTTMNWRNVVKQMQAFAQKQVQLGPSFIAQELSSQAKGEEYKVFRETAQQQWDKTRTCYQKAAAAYSNGEKNYAAYMSEQKQGDGKCFDNRFAWQHVKPAVRLLKLHLLFGTYISSVQCLRIITGCGSNGIGKSVLKQSVTSLLKKEGIVWREENQGTVLIRLDGPREFSFLDSGSDSD